MRDSTYGSIAWRLETRRLYMRIRKRVKDPDGYEREASLHFADAMSVERNAALREVRHATQE